MSAAIAEPDTLADVVHALGDVPLHRILFHKLGSATEEDGWTFWKHKIRAELVDGVFVVKAIDRETLRGVLDDFVPGTETLADVLDRLGNIPLDRILWEPRPGTATEADQLRCCDGEPKRLVELVDGILVEKAMGHRESLFAVVLLMYLGAHVRPRKLGILGAPDAIMKMTTRRNRLADVSFTPWERLPSADAHLKPVARFSGDLMVEIISADNTRAEIEQKRREYFATGTRLVWIIEPEDETVAVYTNPDDFTLLKRSDTLNGGVVLPGFTLPLEELFGDPQLNPRPE